MIEFKTALRLSKTLYCDVRAARKRQVSLGEEEGRRLRVVETGRREDRKTKQEGSHSRVRSIIRVPFLFLFLFRFLFIFRILFSWWALSIAFLHLRTYAYTNLPKVAFSG